MYGYQVLPASPADNFCSLSACLPARLSFSLLSLILPYLLSLIPPTSDLYRNYLLHESR